jgi:hypothetical protein
MLPFLIRHYRSPVTLSDIPALREDDSSVAVTAAFRANQAHYDSRWAARNLGEDRKRDLGFNLFRFFIPEISAQSVSSELGRC